MDPKKAFWIGYLKTQSRIKETLQKDRIENFTLGVEPEEEDCPNTVWITDGTLSESCIHVRNVVKVSNASFVFPVHLGVKVCNNGITCLPDHTFGLMLLTKEFKYQVFNQATKDFNDIRFMNLLYVLAQAIGYEYEDTTCTCSINTTKLLLGSIHKSVFVLTPEKLREIVSSQ